MKRRLEARVYQTDGESTRSAAFAWSKGLLIIRRVSSEREIRGGHYHGEMLTDRIVRVKGSALKYYRCDLTGQTLPRAAVSWLEAYYILSITNTILDR